jgi:hypothetical protein
VDDPFLVCGFERLGDLQRDAKCVFDLQRSALQPVGEGLALEDPEALRS